MGKGNHQRKRIHKELQKIRSHPYNIKRPHGRRNTRRGRRGRSSGTHVFDFWRLRVKRQLKQRTRWRRQRGKKPQYHRKNLPRNQDPLGAKKQTKDAESFYNYLQSIKGKVALNHKGHPMCYYCGIPSHQRSECRLRLRELDNGIKRPFHPPETNSEKKLKTSCPTRPNYGAILGQVHRQLKPTVHSGQIITTNRPR